MPGDRPERLQKAMSMGADALIIDLEDAVAPSAKAAAREMGFGGKLAIHPRQLAAIRVGFAPSADEVRWARAIQAAGADGAVRVDGAMVDAPLRALADSIVSQADAAPTEFWLFKIFSFRYTIFVNM